MITVRTKNSKVYCSIECCHCFQHITYRGGDLDECPYCMEELPQPLDLIDRMKTRIAYFFIGDE